jgi:hypothetical protein
MRRNFSIGLLMCLIAVIAADVALARFASKPDRDGVVAVWIAPIVLAAQVGWMLAVGGRSRRPFWLGFAVAGAGITLSFLGAATVPRFPTVHAWVCYSDLVSRGIARTPVPDIVERIEALPNPYLSRPLVWVFVAAIIVPTMIAIAALGGLATYMIVRIYAKLSDPQPPGPETVVERTDPAIVALSR